MSIGIIALLVAIALPAIGKARHASKRLASLARIRQLHHGIALYQQGADARYPAIMPGRTYEYPPGVLTSSPYFQIETFWPGVIGQVLPYGEHIDVYRSPFEEVTDAGRWPTSFHMSHSVVCPPRVWSDSWNPLHRHEVAQRDSDVRHPSNKVLLFDNDRLLAETPAGEEIGSSPSPTAMAMVDGSAQDRVPAEATAPFLNPVNTIHTRDNHLHNTPLGVWGRDY